MLRVETKDNCIRILKNVELLCQKGLRQENDLVLSVLQEVQSAIIEVGNRFEKELQDASVVVSMLEGLCESFYRVSTDLDDKEAYAEEIAQSLKQIIEIVSVFETVYQVVFFPYKADMWDSLESIYLTCKKDARCDCKVVPIPYYHFDAKKNEWIYCYEIDRFPADIPVVNYADYSLEERPDVAFVHNPYDEFNNVTHIHSDYYSYNLKKYVKNLFYVPYYVTSGFISEDQKMLSVYLNADYFVVQSESFKEGLQKYTYGKKAKVFGSPKLDKVIRMCTERQDVPEEWQRLLAGKKTLMLNTSLNQFLFDGQGYLNKIAYLFEKIKRRDDVAIVWRPHPLLLSTIESMRPHLLDGYLQLRQDFLDSKIGVFDATPDVAKTVAFVDGYIGETSSSVVNLFEAAGKPLFILNNYILDDFTGEQKRAFLLSDCEYVNDTLYATSLEHSAICEVIDSNWENLIVKNKRADVARWLPASNVGVRLGDDIYYSPVWTEEFYKYNSKKKAVQPISFENRKNIQSYRSCVAYGKKIFYLPNVTKCIAEYDTITGAWKEHAEPIKALQKDVAERILEDTFGYFVYENCIWITTMYSNRVICFNMDTANYQMYEVGDGQMRYGAVAVIGQMLYLSDAQTGRIISWDIQLKKKQNEYQMPYGFKMYRNAQGRCVAHNRFYVVDNTIVAIPCTANSVVKLDLKSQRVEMMAEKMWEDVFLPASFYNYEATGVVSFSKMIAENTLFVQKRRDASLIELDVHTGEYKIHHPKLAPGEFEKMLEGEDGFEKSYTNGEFARRESKYFSFEGFLDDLVNDRLGSAMERQKKEMETMAVNLDGTCGEKVHEFMMQVLTQK